MTNKIGLVKYSLVSLTYLKILSKFLFTHIILEFSRNNWEKKSSPLLSWLALDFRRKKDIFVCCRFNTYTLRVPQVGRLAFFFMS